MSKKYKTVLAHGSFDLFHYGHLKYLQSAKKFGDKLIVSLTSDKFIRKGPNRPIFKEKERLEIIKSLKFVDDAFLSREETAISSIKKIKPDFYVKGNDYKDFKKDISKNIIKEKKEVEKYNGKLVFTNEKTFSSSNLINNNFNIFNKNFLKETKNIDISKILSKINFNEKLINNLKIAVIGDTIIDTYKFVSALNKSNKENIISYNYESENIFLGGSLAAANTLSSFVKNIDLITAVGSDLKIKKILKKKMQKNVNIINFSQPNYEPIVKTRFIEKNTMIKNYQLYNMNSNQNMNVINKKLNLFLQKELHKYDLVIVADFGHGLINEKTVRLLEKKAKYLTVNCQSNSANQGFNLISKYKKFNYGSIDLYEAKLATQKINLDPSKFMQLMKNKTKFNQFSITLGKYGCTIFKKKKYFKLSTPKSNAVDAMGAGDVFFVITSLFSFLKFDIKEIALLGNCAASIKVNHIGHDYVITKEEILKYLEIVNK